MDALDVHIVLTPASHLAAITMLTNTLDAAAVSYRTHRSAASLQSAPATALFVCDTFDGPEFAALLERGCRYVLLSHVI